MTYKDVPAYRGKTNLPRRGWDSHPAGTSITKYSCNQISYKILERGCKQIWTGEGRVNPQTEDGTRYRAQ